MALEVTIYQNSSAYNTNTLSTVYTILADRIVHMFTRLPSQAGLPGDSSTKLPSVLTIDVGVCTEVISITGIVDANIIKESGLALKSQLETVGRTWWDYGDTDATLPRLKIASGQIYTGNVKSMSFTAEGGTHDQYWNFEMIFVARNKI